ncbi:MAG: SPOR domain-containing protein, partial [Treponema sp.]|nr:SPOR domain-containing protein [Treponema sp.]
NLKIAEQTLEDKTSDSIEIADSTEVTDEQFAEEEFGAEQFAEENFDLTEDTNLALNDTSTDSREENFAIAEDTENFEESSVEENSDVFAAINLEDSIDENLQENVQVEEMSASLEVSDDFSDALANNNEASVDQDAPIASSSLESGKYYVQIAALSSEKNIRETVSKYEKIYPVVLVPLSSGKATQIMIGPLSVDEYGAVIERFKAEGYKDVFARKGK